MKIAGFIFAILYLCTFVPECINQVQKYIQVQKYRYRYRYVLPNRMPASTTLNTQNFVRSSVEAGK